MANPKDHPRHSDKATGKKFPHEQSRDEAVTQLGETSDDYGSESPDLQTEMTEGDQIARSNPDVTQVGPPGGGDVDHGFRDERERRDRPR